MTHDIRADVVLVAMGILLSAVPSAGQMDSVDFLLATGDTNVAIDVLRARLRNGPVTPERQCRLATLLTRVAPPEPTDWTLRMEAERLFQRALRRRVSPSCLLQFAELRARQHRRGDATRLAGRALTMIANAGEHGSPTLLAEAYYRKAMPLLVWWRQFDNMIMVPDGLPVTTPGCADAGAFCEAYAHPANFFHLLAARPNIEDVAEESRAAALALLDSALRWDPGHEGATVAILSLAAAEGDWHSFRGRATAAYAARPQAVGTRLAMLTATHQLGQHREAGRWFDSVQALVGVEALARFEGLALIADTSLRERLSGDSMVVYGEAVWGLSDPLYLTATNERRVAHYARVYLAELLYTDQEAGMPGRNTAQGRLLIRYGMPEHIFVLRADRSAVMSEAQRDMIAGVLQCSTRPVTSYAVGQRRGSEELGACAYPAGPGHAFDGQGRWEFWYYTEQSVPFIFERALGSWTARHMFETPSLDLDRHLDAVTPNSYVAPFGGADIRALVTRFPHPGGPQVEVAGRFTLTGPSSGRNHVRMAVFAHSMIDGKLIDHAIIGPLQRRPDDETTFHRRMNADWGGVQLSVEGIRYPLDGTAAQQRHVLDFQQPEADELVVSDLLLGDSARVGPALTTRADVRFAARSDSLVEVGASLALYWETYGLAANDSGLSRYRVRLTIRDVRDERGLTAVVRRLGEALGVREPTTETLRWDMTRLAAPVLPDVLVLEHVPDAPLVRLSLEITDLLTGRRAATSRIISVVTRSPM